VTANFVCEAAVLDMDGNKREGFTRTIVSVLNAERQESDPLGEAEVEGLPVRQEDLDAEINYSTRAGGSAGPRFLNEGIHGAMAGALGRGATADSIKERLATIPGMTEARIAVLFVAFRLPG